MPRAVTVNKTHKSLPSRNYSLKSKILGFCPSLPWCTCSSSGKWVFLSLNLCFSRCKIRRQDEMISGCLHLIYSFMFLWSLTAVKALILNKINGCLVWGNKIDGTQYLLEAQVPKKDDDILVWWNVSNWKAKGSSSKWELRNVRCQVLKILLHECWGSHLRASCQSYKIPFLCRMCN